MISPLLANIYLNLLDRNFARHVARGELQGRLVRYADDFVLLSPRRPQSELAWLGKMLGLLDLKLHPAKTRVLDARCEDFDFLGHKLRWRGGRLYLDISRKSLSRIREALRSQTRHYGMSLEALIGQLNPYIRGARGYFRKVRRQRLSTLDYYLGIRIARWWTRKHAQRRPAWSLVTGGRLQRQYGLEKWYVPWAILRQMESRSAQ